MNLAEPLVQASLVGEAIDDGPVRVMVADDDMNYIAVNRYAADVLGYTREEFLSLKVPDVTPGAESAAIPADVAAHRHHDRFADVVRKDGTRLRVGYRSQETRVAGMTVYVSVGSIVGA